MMNSKMIKTDKTVVDEKLFEQFCFDFYGELLSERQKTILDYYYNDDYALAEIGEIIGMTRQGVHDAFRRAKSRMASYEEKLGLVSRFLENRTVMAQVREEISVLLSDSEHQDYGVLCRELRRLESKLGEIIEGS